MRKYPMIQGTISEYLLSPQSIGGQDCELNIIYPTQTL